MGDRGWRTHAAPFSMSVRGEVGSGSRPVERDRCFRDVCGRQIPARKSLRQTQYRRYRITCRPVASARTELRRR